MSRSVSPVSVSRMRNGMKWINRANPFAPSSVLPSQGGLDLKLGNALGGLGLYRRHATGNISPHLSSHPRFPSISSLAPLKLNLTYFIVLDIYGWLRYSTISNITPLTNKTTRNPVNLQAMGRVSQSYSLSQLH